MVLIILISANILNLQGGSSSKEGNIYIDNLPICSNSFGWQEADVVCRELGYNNADSFSRGTLFGKIPNWFMNSWTSVNCQGNEDSLEKCVHKEDGKCSDDNGVALSCSNGDNGKNKTSINLLIELS